MSNNNPNRPRGRQKNVTGQGKDIYKKGQGLGTGPVGNANRPQNPGVQNAAGQQGNARAGGTRSLGGGKLILIILAAVVLFGGGGGLSGLFGSLLGGETGSIGSNTQGNYTAQGQTQLPAQTQSQAQTGQSALSDLDLASLLGLGSTSGMGQTSSGWTGNNNTRRLNTGVASGSRAKRTIIKGDGTDTVTLMVYMCGTDLESKYGMGTSDLQEMLAATLSDQINLVVFTGGCRQWKNNVVSSTVNQIYKVENGNLITLEQNAGTAAMTDPNNLAAFIQYCARNYPANRNALIFWDHGGGSLSGYGYDEKNSSAGSMSLAGIDQALKAGGVTFDFIGFDACLMATLENALMLTNYGDYLIASEETEPGVGWYYTSWLTKLSQNTGMSTLDIGKNICDDFVSVCSQKCQGQSTTLSVIDLAELEHTVPAALKSFSTATAGLLQQGEYRTVSTARSGTREFASSSKIDQVDLVNLCQNLNTAESSALANTLLEAVKYNNTSTNMTNAYGVSIYFPYQRTSKVNSAVAEYSAIGLDDEYGRVIQQFASYENGGQAASVSTGSPLSSLLGGGYGSALGEDAIAQLLGSLLGGGRSLGDVGLDEGTVSGFLADNQFDAGALVWTGDTPAIYLSAGQWRLVNDLELNVFFDDGEGFIDLGLDNSFSFTQDGGLSGEFAGTWLAINDQPVAYYHTGTTDNGEDYTITGYVPILLNGERAQLQLVFDSETPAGYIAGVVSDYHEGETETIAKTGDGLQEGDEITFLCDYYSYDGAYQDSYQLGEVWTYDGTAVISDVYIDAAKARPTYRFTDLYNQDYWTPVME